MLRLVGYAAATMLIPTGLAPSYASHGRPGAAPVTAPNKPCPTPTETVHSAAPGRGKTAVDTEDWKAHGSDARYWIDRITRRATVGAQQRHPVVLMHDADEPGGPATVSALPSIIKFYRRHGYAFVDLLGRTGYPAGARRTDRPFASAPRSSDRFTLAVDGGGGHEANRRGS